MSIELKRKRLELSRVQLAREEQEFKIDERMEEINRLKSMVQIQLNKEDELNAEITALLNRGE